MPQDTAAAGGDVENSNDGYYQKLDGKEETGGTIANFVACKKAAVGLPLFVMPVLTASIFLGAIAGPIMKRMESEGAAPLAVGSWRHQVSAAMMFPFAVWQWFSMKSEDRTAALSWSNAGAICLCALGLACHFGFWIWSLDNTALTHSLFLCILSPIFVTVFTFLRDGRLVCGELLGVALGLVGSTILAAGAQVEKDEEFTVIGDLAALASACGFAVYLMFGKDLRGKLPLFIYLWPVNIMVGTYLTIALIFFKEIGGLNEYHDVGLFNWITQGYGMTTVLLGVGPGFLSHIGYNISMGYVKPLIVSVGFSVIPVVGSFLGWWMGETGVPGLLTLLGGLVTIIATILVSNASRKEAKAKAEGLYDETPSEKVPLVRDGEQ